MSSTVLAHGSVNERIAAINKTIAENPSRAELYVMRAELHVEHGDFQAAHADYQLARTLNPKLADIDLHLGVLLFREGKLNKSLTVLDRFLRAHPTHGEARIVRADVFAALGQHDKAVRDLDRVLEKRPPKSASLYLRRAQWLAARGLQYTSNALAGLDQGINSLGPLVTLQGFAIELERKRGRFDLALARWERLPSPVKKAPHWLCLRGDLLLKQGKKEQALHVYRQALSRIASLPASRRKSQAIHQLRQQLEKKVPGRWLETK